MEKIKEVIMEPGVIGRVRGSDRRVWLNVNVMAVLESGKVKQKRFPKYKDATAYAAALLEKGEL